MCNSVIFKDSFSIRYIPDQYKTQQMCDCFVTSKMLQKLDIALHAYDDILFYNEDFNTVTFIACQRQILAADRDKIKLDNDNNFYGDDPDTIIPVRLLAWRSNFKKRKAL